MTVFELGYELSEVMGSHNFCVLKSHGNLVAGKSIEEVCVHAIWGGKDWWPYGIQKNRHVLETFLRYHHEQGLSDRLMAVEELFAPETLDEEFKI
jgi:hypothetical protein